MYYCALHLVDCMYGLSLQTTSLSLSEQKVEQLERLHAMEEITKVES